MNQIIFAILGLIIIIGMIILSLTKPKLLKKRHTLFLSYTFILIIPLAYIWSKFDILALEFYNFVFFLTIISSLAFLKYNLFEEDKNYISLFGKWFLNSLIFIIIYFFSFLFVDFWDRVTSKSHGDMQGLLIVIVCVILIGWTVIVLIARIIKKIITNIN